MLDQILLTLADISFVSWGFCVCVGGFFIYLYILPLKYAFIAKQLKRNTGGLRMNWSLFDYCLLASD